MTSRRVWLGLVLLLSSCKNMGDKMEILPMNLGDWKRMAVENIPAEDHPREFKERGIKRARRAIYNGPARLTATIYEFGALGTAFELVQKWRPQEGKMASQEGVYFILLDAQGVEGKIVNDFASKLEAFLRK